LWLHEIKHDGFRTIARKDSRRTRLYDQLGNDLTQCFPLIAGALARLPSCTIDGETVAYDDSGVPSFDLLRRRPRGDRTFLHAFDLIELAGDDRRRDPLEQRKVDLSRLLADTSQGATVFERVCSAGLEGIVSKRKDARYISGRSPYWLKMKNPRSEAVRREAEDELAKQSVSSVESPETTALANLHISRHEAEQPRGYLVKMFQSRDIQCLTGPLKSRLNALSADCGSWCRRSLKHL
jgi:ATP-dependent DNA ligase